MSLNQHFNKNLHICLQIHIDVFYSIASRYKNTNISNFVSLYLFYFSWYGIYIKLNIFVELFKI